MLKKKDLRLVFEELTMNLKQLKDTIMVSTVLMWIPLGILAFYFSPVRIDIKLAIAALASLTAMLVVFLKEG